MRGSYDLDPNKVIGKLSQKVGELELQVAMLTVALEEEIAKKLEGGVASGNTEQSTNSSSSKKA